MVKAKHYDTLRCLEQKQKKRRRGLTFKHDRFEIHRAITRTRSIKTIGKKCRLHSIPLGHHLNKPHLGWKLTPTFTKAVMQKKKKKVPPGHLHITVKQSQVIGKRQIMNKTQYNIKIQLQ